MRNLLDEEYEEVFGYATEGVTGFGVAVASFAGAMTSLALGLSPNPFAALEIVFWMLGSLADRSMDHVWLALPFILVSWALLGGLGRGLDALTLGEEAAASMGVPLGRLRLLLLFGVAAGVGGATAVPVLSASSGSWSPISCARWLVPGRRDCSWPRPSGVRHSCSQPT